MNDIAPHRIAIPESDLDDLRRRLDATRWPDEETVNDWTQGTPLAWVRELCELWATEYDWRDVETRLDRGPAFTTTIDGTELYFLHRRSPAEDAIPLLITHGWPGGIAEQLDLLDSLADPPAGGQAFHVVVPALPGYGFAPAPRTTGWGVERISDAWVTLMSRLGYERFGAHGGDWGSYITATLGERAPRRLLGIHLTMPVAAKPEKQVELTELEKSRFAAAGEMWRTGSGYVAIQSTRPQSLGYGLEDSPAGLAAWVGEKFHAWSDHGGKVEDAISRTRILDSVSALWLTRSATSAARLYWESSGKTSTGRVEVPTGCSIFPQNAWIPRAWCEERFADLRTWNELASGGHFPALEAPTVLADELRTFFGSLER